MNNVILSGNIANIYINSNNTRIVIASTYKQKTSFITVTCFNSTAEFVKNYMQVGDHVAITGRLGTYKDSCNRETIDVIADRINFEGYPKPSRIGGNNKEEDTFIKLSEADELLDEFLNGN